MITLKGEIRILKNVKYNPNKWKYAMKSGCYPYAINIFIDKFLLIGDLIGKPCNEKVSDEKLIKTFLKEMEFLKYEVKEIDSYQEIKENEWKVYIQREEHTGYYHFLRQDEDGIWSHKFPNELPIRTDSAGQIIKSPDEMIEAPFNGWCFCLKQRKVS